MRIAITGASGFLGRHFLTRLNELPGMSPMAITSSIEGMAMLHQMDPELDVLRVSKDHADITGRLAGVDVLVHLAWASVPATATVDPLLDMDSNLPPAIRLIEEAARAGVKRFVFLSSGGTVYGPARYLPIDERHPLMPVSAYGINKLLMEQYLSTLASQHPLEIVVLRPSNVYGDTMPRSRPQGVVEHWMASLLRGERPQVWGSMAVVRDFLHVSDMVDVMVAALERIPAGCTLNVGTGVGTSLADLAGSFGRIIGRVVDPEIVAAQPPSILSNVLDARALQDLLGAREWISLEDGLVRTWSGFDPPY
jgi:UDP-glucose 4-epimerase